MKRITLLAAASLLALLATVGGANAAGLIGSDDIRDDSIRGKDLRSGLLDRLDQRAEVKANADEIKALKAQVAALSAQPAAGAPNAAEWVPNAGAVIVDATTVALSGGNTSLETTDLDLPVQAGSVVSFHYELEDGAECIGGAPRLFVVMQGETANTNSWDSNIGDGLAAACGGDSQNVEFTVPDSGRIGQVGLVYDNGGIGTITISDVMIAGQLVNFS